jgi:hypothetical protein
MGLTSIATHRPMNSRALTVGLRIAIVGLTLATARIHLALGGLLFTLDAIGYATLAAAMVLPGPFGQVRWLTRYALIGFAAATVVGWLVFGARFDLAYLDKGIEVTLISLVLVESSLIDGGPLTAARRIYHRVGRLVG